MTPWQRELLEAFADAFETAWELTDAIRAALREIDRLGMMVDAGDPRMEMFEEFSKEFSKEDDE